MTDVKLDFDDILMVPRFTGINSRKNVNLITPIKGVWGSQITGIPIIAANMNGVGTFPMCEALAQRGLFTALVKTTTVEEWKAWARKTNQEIVEKAFVSVGMSAEDLEKIDVLYRSNMFLTMKIVIDVANGYMNDFYTFIRRVRDIAPLSFIIAGTICTPEAAERIVECGADMARVGIGTGAVCTTRQVAGVGYPQASAIMECGHYPIVCDGGCVYPGDFAKAFALGADMIMAGSVFAGHDEGLIHPLPDHGEKQDIMFFGMSSHEAQTLQGKRNSYRPSEGRVVKIPYRGKVLDTVDQILGGIRSACAYTNNSSIIDLRYNRPDIIRVNNQLNRSLENYTI